MARLLLLVKTIHRRILHRPTTLTTPDDNAAVGVVIVQIADRFRNESDFCNVSLDVFFGARIHFSIT